MKKHLILVALIFSLGIPAVYAQQALPGDNPGTNSVTGTSAPTPGTTAAETPPANTTPTGGQTGFTALAPIPGLTDSGTTSVVNSTTLATFFNNLYKYLIGLAGVLAVIEIIWGGLEIATNKDNVSKLMDGKGRILQALLGLVLVLSPVLVFSIINPSILNLSVNLPELNTKSGSSSRTQAATLSSTDLQSRQQWGQVLDTFTVSSALSPRDRITQLDAKQVQCTQMSGGVGVILPQQGMQGGSFTYVCQTCPANSTLTLYSPGTINDTGQRGACSMNSMTQQPTTAGEGYYPSPQSGMSCLVPKDTSQGSYYCAKDSTSCNVALKSFGAANVTSGCTSY